MRFTKMHGAGNDFIVLNPAETADRDLGELARRACDRHFGVGADGILIPASSEVADIKMVHLNSDGSSSEMCGNGIRCLALYAKDRGLIRGERLSVETGAGVKEVLLSDDGSSRVNMGPPEFDSELELHGFRFVRVSMGNPHAVAFLGDESEVEALDLRSLGPRVENDGLFPEKTNAEFVHARNSHDLRMRIWERGAGETLASGSGSCAAAVAAVRQGLAKSPVRVHLDGGIVEIEWTGEGPVHMTGPAAYICEGTLRLRLS